MTHRSPPAGFVNKGRCTTYSPDGKSLAIGSGKLVRVWDAAQGKVTATYRGHKSVVYSVAFSSDGKKMASGGEGGLGVENPGEVRLWSLAKEGSLVASQEHNGQLNWVMFASDDKVLISGGPLRVTLWNAPRIEKEK
jgi:WD40 repeat protein